MEVKLEEMGNVDVNFSDSELVYHVRDALLSVQSGDTDSYQKLVEGMRHSQRLAPDEVALLVTSLRALSGAVSYIDSVHHESLLNSIFGMNMWKYGPDVMDALLELIISLAASNGEYVVRCLDMLVSHFMPPTYLVDILKQPRGQEKKTQVLSRVHLALENIAHLVPMAASRLGLLVIGRMPMIFKKDLDKDRMKYCTEMYVENMLRLESGAIREFTGSTMLIGLVKMLVDLDVEIGWEDILRDDPCKGIFVIELEDEADTDDYDGKESDDNELPRILSLKSLDKNVIADLLDSLMVQTCEHLESCARNERLTEVFDTLLGSFMQTILNTYKSKFAQFVMFYACALDPQNCGVKFAMTLADEFVCGRNPINRMSAVAYLASYLARGKFLSSAFVASVLKRLVDWCLEYCKSQDGGMDPKAHQVFYSGCQAIMYVLCFHMRSMMDFPWLKSQLLIPLELILKHKLGPLKVCLPSIVEEFLEQAKAAHLLTISENFIFEDLLESDLSRDFGGLERLDTFFPFDPCLLKRCNRNFIRQYFKYWTSVRTTYGGNEEDSSDEDIAENFAEERRTSFDKQDLDLDLDEFDYALNKMSITPKNGFIRLGAEQMRMPSRIRPSTSPESL